MSRPTTTQKGSVLYWPITISAKVTGLLAAPDSAPTVTVRKNGVTDATAVTVTLRSTGIYDCEFDPSDEAVGDQFQFRESVVLDGDTYDNTFTVLVVDHGLFASGATDDSSDVTLEQVQAALLDNADYRVTNSVTKAKAFVTACTRFLAVFPTATSAAGTSVTYTPANVAILKAEAEAFIRSRAQGGRVRHLTISDDFR